MAAQPRDIVENLKENWLRQGLSLPPGASPDSILQLEKKYQCRLPDDFRRYLSLIGGMFENDTDLELIRFWQVHEIESLFELEYQNDFPDSVCLVFADYLIYSHYYVLALSRTGKCQVYVTGAPTPKLMADSFSEFLELYLTEDKHQFLTRYFR